MPSKHTAHGLEVWLSTMLHPFSLRCAMVRAKLNCGTLTLVCECMFVYGCVCLYFLMQSGTLLQDMPFKYPFTALFFHHNPNILIVACKDGIFIVNVRTLSIQPFTSTLQGALFYPHAISLSDDDAVLVAGCISTQSVCGYDTASLKRLWIHNAVSHVGAVCKHHGQVLVSVHGNPTLLMDLNTGAHIAELHKADSYIFGLGVIEGLWFILSRHQIISELHTSVYLAMLQHLLSKQAKSLRLPLEMWDWIAKSRL
jgi:hypothetical protein